MSIVYLFIQAYLTCATEQWPFPLIKCTMDPVFGDEHRSF